MTYTSQVYKETKGMSVGEKDKFKDQAWDKKNMMIKD